MEKSAIDCMVGMSTCERINNLRFEASIMDMEIIKLLPQKENLVLTLGICREDPQAPYKLRL